jgi:outer membrane protein
MKNLLIVFVALLLVPSGSVVAQQPDSISLDDMIALVLNNNSMAREAEKDVDASLAAIEVSRSSLYPDARGDLSYTRLGPIAEITLPGTGTFQLYPANNYDGHVSVRQKVYDFNKTSSSIDLTRSLSDLARDRLERVKRDLAYAAVRSFYSVLFLRQGISVQDDQIDALSQYLSFTRKKLQAGAATDFDVLTTRVRLGAAESRKIDLVNVLRKGEIALRRLADLPGDAPLNLHGAFEADANLPDADSLLVIALRQRTDFKEAEDEVRSAEIQTQVAARTDNPSVDINLAYGAKNGYIPNLDVLRGNFVAGVSVQVPIFDGFRTTGLEQEAEAKLLAARERKHAVETQVRADIMDAMSDLRSSREKLQTSELNVEQAESAVGLAKTKYEAGVITNLDLLDAQTALEQARLSDLQSLYEFVLSRYGLKEAVGEKIW